MATCNTKLIYKCWFVAFIGCALLAEKLTYRKENSTVRLLHASFDSHKIKTNIVRSEAQLMAATTKHKFPAEQNDLNKTVLLDTASRLQDELSVKQVLYWRGPKMKIPDGKYFCPKAKSVVKFTSRGGYHALSASHAVILHHTGNWNIKLLERHRPKGQMWIYMSRESPPHSTHGRVPNVFNWTMTYRSDSDFPISYGDFKYYNEESRKSYLLQNKGKNWATGKTKLAAWISSNCNGPSWPRVAFVRNLSKHMSVDMFGRCGDRICPKGTSCFDKLRSYKFYLALENSRCTDYITEKMWRNAFMYDTVPIVYGTNEKNYEQLAPPNSFIHVSDFPNMTSLVAYIALLDKNDTMYNKFFEWKYSSFIEEEREDKVITKETLCSIAAKLRDFNIGSSEIIPNNIFRKTTSLDMNKMWFDTCKESSPLPLPV